MTVTSLQVGYTQTLPNETIMDILCQLDPGDPHTSQVLATCAQAGDPVGSAALKCNPIVQTMHISSTKDVEDVYNMVVANHTLSIIKFVRELRINAARFPEARVATKLGTIVFKCVSLQSLDMTGGTLSLHPVRPLTTLTRLTLDGVQFSRTHHILNLLPRLPNLEYLVLCDISHPALVDSGFDMPLPANLRSLHIGIGRQSTIPTPCDQFLRWLIADRTRVANISEFGYMNVFDDCVGDLITFLGLSNLAQLSIKIRIGHTYADTILSRYLQRADLPLVWYCTSEERPLYELEQPQIE